MFLNLTRGLRAVSSSFALLALSCGARTSIYTSDAGAPEPCEVDIDCDTGDLCARAQCLEGTCVALPAVVCDDHDSCTDDACDSQNGQCSYTPITLDLDFDGHRAPKPGFSPGAPGACGDDCDDRSAAAFPGGKETCDGVDNDCNGKVDDNAQYGNLQTPVRVGSKVFDKTNGSGMAFDGRNYGITFSGHEQRWSSYFTSLARSGMPVVPETPLSDLNSETYAGPLIHNGSYFASAWPDARQDGNYEIYFNRYDSKGNKAGPDLRITRAPKFSLDPVLAWNGKESILIWDDRRNEPRDGSDIRLYGQRIAFDGTLIGDNVALTGSDIKAERPGIALSRTKIGIAFTSQVADKVVRAKFFTTAPDLSQPSSIVDLGGTDVNSVSVVYVGGHFGVFWDRSGSSIGPSIYGVTVDESGNQLSPALPVTSGANFARSFSAVSLGDRVLLIWADDHDGNYELYLQILDAGLNVLTPRTRLSFSSADSLSPVAALGPNGDLGVLFDELENGGRQAYFIGMSCAMNGSVSPPN
jgi:hypothetical protein